MNLLSLISSLGKAGKSSLEIARELHAQGLTNDRGKTITPDMVMGFLRFAGVSTDAGALPAMETVSGAVWGSRLSSSASDAPAISFGAAPKERKAKRHKWIPGSNLSESQRAEITRLYQQEFKSAGEIAAILNINPLRVNPFCAHLAGFSVPPGEITEYTDADGHTVTKCPPGWARGVYPQRNVGGA